MLTFMYIVTFAPWCAFYLTMAADSWRALKRDSPGLNVVADSYGQAVAPLCIVALPFMLLFLMALFGLLGSAVLGWAGAALFLANYLHERGKSKALIVVAGTLGVILTFGSIAVAMPYTPVPFPDSVMQWQRPLLGYRQL